MNRKIVIFSVCAVLICAVLAGCGKNAINSPGSASAEKDGKVAVGVTDENGKAVTDKDGNFVTEIAEAVTDKDGNYVTENATDKSGKVLTDENGNPKTVVVTKGNKKSTTKEQTVNAGNGKIPYSTTSPEANVDYNGVWNFGSVSNVGINAPNGWTAKTVNELTKDGTSISVSATPKNYLAPSFTTVQQYADFMLKASYSSESGAKNIKRISFAKEVYKNGEAIQMLYRAKREGKTKYEMTYIFRSGDDIMVYFVYADTQEEAKVSIADVIANTYYREG